MENELIRLCDRPELIETAAQWFHEKCGVPLAAYLESMNDSLTANAVPPAGMLCSVTTAR